jgi:hypothetical protein
MAFGVLFGILLNNVTLSAYYQPFTARNKILFVLLILILLLGIGGEQLLESAARRVSKLSVGGAEIAFYDPAQARRGRPEGDLSLAAGGHGNPMAGAPALSLAILANLPDFIQRDKIYIQAAYQQRKDAPKGPLFTRLDDAKSLAKSLVSPFGSCMLEIYTQTGDISFVRSTLAGLLRPLRDLGDLAAPTQSAPARFADDGALALMKLWRDLFIFAFDRRGVFASLAPQESASKCHTMAYAFCSPDTWNAKRQAIRDSNIPAINDRVFRTCYDDAIRSQNEKSPQSEEKLRGEIRDALFEFAGRDDYYLRPYTAIIIATIFAQLGQHEAALAQLETWLKRQTGDAIETKWLKVRALIIAIYAAEYWIRKDGANASVVLRDFSLKQLELALTLTDELFSLKEELRGSRLAMSVEDLTKASFSRPPTETEVCAYKTAPGVRSDFLGNRKILYWWYVTNLALTARHRLTHPEYAKLHAHLANKEITALLITDLGCANTSEAEKVAFRAWVLRMYATMQLQDVVSQKDVRTRASLEAMLENGLRASELGLLMVRHKAESELQKKRAGGNEPLLQRLASTSEIAAYEELSRVRHQLLEARKNLD